MEKITGSAQARGVNRNPKARNPKEKGVTLIIGTLSMLFIIPMMGLAIDVGFLYAVKSKLQASVDGAALASARALSIGATLSAQTTTAQAHAVNWFSSNFPTGYFGTYNTVMGTSNVNVWAGTGASAQVRNVTVSAQTTVDTFFMRWLGFGSTTLAANGNASRRTVVAMLVLDRSGSMCTGGTAPCTKTQSTLPCAAMINAAKVFTGQFAAGSDYIGLISFSDNVYIHSVPTTNFQSVLGYSNTSGSGTGAIDGISCDGGTSTAQAVSMAYQAIYQANLPGAMNVVMLETDGMPNTLAMNFYDSTNLKAGLTSGSGCKDAASKTLAGGGFKTVASVPPWTYGLAMNGTAGQTNGFATTNSYTSPYSTTTGFFPNIPAGMVMSVASSDPSSTSDFFTPIYYWTVKPAPANNTPGQQSSNNYNSTQYLSPSGCGSGGGESTKTPTDIGWFPKTDVFGNSLNPLSYTYQSVTTDSYGHITQSGSTPGNWSNFHAAVLNATDNAAYQIRNNTTWPASTTTTPATVFTLGLGGNATLDYVLLQRMANDPNGDEFNTTGPLTGGAYYLPCAQATACATWSTQPQGTFIYAPTSTYLAQAFLRISSQVLRLSK
jgi:Flp pilus assembly protein TadG